MERCKTIFVRCVSRLQQWSWHMIFSRPQDGSKQTILQSLCPFLGICFRWCSFIFWSLLHDKIRDLQSFSSYCTTETVGIVVDGNCSLKTSERKISFWALPYNSDQGLTFLEINSWKKSRFTMGGIFQSLSKKTFVTENIHNIKIVSVDDLI